MYFCIPMFVGRWHKQSLRRATLRVRHVFNPTMWGQSRIARLAWWQRLYFPQKEAHKRRKENNGVGIGGEDDTLSFVLSKRLFLLPPLTYLFLLSRMRLSII